MQVCQWDRSECPSPVIKGVNYDHSIMALELAAHITWVAMWIVGVGKESNFSPFRYGKHLEELLRSWSDIERHLSWLGKADERSD